jgi:hypothetical protein
VITFLQLFPLFPEAVFLMVAMESLLDEEQVLSSWTSITAQNRLNFLLDRWITPEFLQEFV